MSFTKLDRGILQSSIMAEPAEIFKVWVAFLAACDADGIARVAPPYIAAVTYLPIETVRAAIQRLEGPDEDSRSTNDDGRRIRRVDGGWELINYARYRARTPQEYEAERRRKYRRNNPSVTAEENYRRRHPPNPPSSDGEEEEEGEGEPSRTDSASVPDGQNGHPPTNGLLPIPRALAFELRDPLVKERAEIRRLARMIAEGKHQDGPDCISPEGLERRRQAFNQRIKDLT